MYSDVYSTSPNIWKAKYVNIPLATVESWNAKQISRQLNNKITNTGKESKTSNTSVPLQRPPWKLGHQILRHLHGLFCQAYQTKVQFSAAWNFHIQSFYYCEGWEGGILHYIVQSPSVMLKECKKCFKTSISLTHLLTIVRI